MRSAHSVVRIILRLVLVCAFLVLLVVALQDVLIFPGVFIERPANGAPVPGGIERASVRTQDGIVIDVWRRAPRQREARGVAILFHGAGDTLARFSPVQDWIANLGFVSYAVDYRGFGASNGWPSEQGLYSDAEAVWRYVVAHEQATSKQVLIVGQSVGVAPAAYLAAQHQVNTLVLLSPFLSMTELVKSYPFFRHFTGFMRYSFPVGKYLQKLQQTCVVIAHGEKDKTVPVSHSRSLEAQLVGRIPVYSVYPPLSGHPDVLWGGKHGVEVNLERCWGGIL